jgi:phage protein D
MTTADKTRQKLVDSMRKSKSGATGKPAASKPAASKAATGSRATPAKKTPARRAPARKAAQPQRPPAAAAAMTAVTWQSSTDPYQSDGRIWPD